MARQFFDGSSQGPMAQPAFSMPLHMAPPEMAQSMRAGPDLSSMWSGMPHNQLMPEHMHHTEGFKSVGSSGWANEFDVVSRASASPAMQQAPQVPCACHPYALIEDFLIVFFVTAYQGLYMNSGMYGAMPMGGMYAPNFTAPAGLIQNLDKGKGKSRELDFEAAFAQFAASMNSDQTQSARVEEVDDSVAELSETLQNTGLENDTTKASDFRAYVSLFFGLVKRLTLVHSRRVVRVWEQLQNSDLPPPKDDMAKWESQFNQLMNADRDENGVYGDSMQNSWEGGLGDFENAFGEQSIKFDEEGLPLLGTYTFGTFQLAERSQQAL